MHSWDGELWRECDNLSTFTEHQTAGLCYVFESARQVEIDVVEPYLLRERSGWFHGKVRLDLTIADDAHHYVTIVDIAAQWPVSR